MIELLEMLWDFISFMWSFILAMILGGIMIAIVMYGIVEILASIGG